MERDYEFNPLETVEFPVMTAVEATSMARLMENNGTQQSCGDALRFGEQPRVAHPLWACEEMENRLPAGDESADRNSGSFLPRIGFTAVFLFVNNLNLRRYSTSCRKRAKLARDASALFL